MAEYLIQDTTLTNLSNSVRALDGTSDSLTPAQMSNNLNTYNTELGEVVTEQDNLISQIAETLQTKAVNTAIEIDGTLSISGAAADAKVVGDAIADIQSQLENTTTAEHTQAASTITAGTFAGQVKASAQDPGTYLVRNIKVGLTSENPTVNGEIFFLAE